MLIRPAIADAPGGEETEYDIYPPGLHSPYRERRFQVGEDLYRSIGIARDNRPARLAQFARNFMFFDAPLALSSALKGVAQRRIVFGDVVEVVSSGGSKRNKEAIQSQRWIRPDGSRGFLRLALRNLRTGGEQRSRPHRANSPDTVPASLVGAAMNFPPSPLRLRRALVR